MQILLEELIEACRNYDLKPRNRITFEYILIKGATFKTFQFGQGQGGQNGTF